MPVYIFNHIWPDRGLFQLGTFETRVVKCYEIHKIAIYVKEFYGPVCQMLLNGQQKLKEEIRHC